MKKFGQIHVNYNAEKHEEILNKALMIAEIDTSLKSRIQDKDKKKGTMTPLFWYLIENYVNAYWDAYTKLQSKKLEAANA